jgi:tetratricopeptide (TPR) repeat protein
VDDIILGCSVQTFFNRCSGYGRHLFPIAVCIALQIAAGRAAIDKMVQPVGLVTDATDSTIRRAGDRSELTVNRGEMVAPGDKIATGSKGGVTVVFCPTKTSLRIEKDSSVTFSLSHYTATGQAREQGAVTICSLPQLFVNNENGDDDGTSQRETLYGILPTTADLSRRLQEIPDQLRAGVMAATGPLNQALAQNQLDVLALLARAVVYESAGLYYDAGRDFVRAGQLLDNPAWIVPLENNSTARSVFPRLIRADSLGGGGKTYALVVGVSKFATVRPELDWAAQDAVSFRDYLRLPRGGGLQDDVQLRTLTDNTATAPAVRNALVDFLIANARPNDTVILFIATHGVIEGKTNSAYLLTTESDLEKLSSTALPMTTLLDLLDSERCHAGRVLVFVDVCHADRVGSFRSRNGPQIERLLRSGDNNGLFALTASGPTELSEEGAQYGGGHGAFSYFVLRGLNSNDAIVDAKPNPPVITLDSLFEYVHDKVRAATKGTQNPREMGNLNPRLAIVTDLHATPLPLLDYPTRGVIAANLSRGVNTPPDIPPLVQRFREAISQGQILPGDQGSAFDDLPELRRYFGDDHAAYLAEENRLRVALESAGEQVLLQYLKGDEIAQSAIDFEKGAKLFQAAFQLTPEKFSLQSDSLFCQGRALIGLHRYDEAIPLLEKAAKLTPAEAYVWNALGIGYLQKPDYDRAMAAFRDAIQRAPHWVYPRHNLALALRERGNIRAAIEQYLAAIQMAPNYSYLRYNVGLLYQQINDRSNAAMSYQEALDRAPTDQARARVLIARATLEADNGHSDIALRTLDEAARYVLQPEDLLTLRHDKALLLARDDAGHAEAESLWTANLRDDPGYLPSMLALAEALEQWQAPAKAAFWYQQVVSLRPDYVAARIHLARLLALSDPKAAVQAVQQGLARDPKQSLLYEELGQIRVQMGATKSAVDAFCGALEYSTSQTFRAEVSRNMKRVHSRPSDCPRGMFAPGDSPRQ